MTTVLEAQQADALAEWREAKAAAESACCLHHSPCAICAACDDELRERCAYVGPRRQRRAR